MVRHKFQIPAIKVHPSLMIGLIASESTDDSNLLSGVSTSRSPHKVSGSWNVTQSKGSETFPDHWSFSPSISTPASRSTSWSREWTTSDSPDRSGLSARPTLRRFRLTRRAQHFTLLTLLKFQCQEPLLGHCHRLVQVIDPVAPR